MKKVIVVTVGIMMLMQGCGTIRGVGSVFNGIGKDIQAASDGYNQEYYDKYNAPRIKR